MKRYVITKEVLDIIHEADTDLNEVRRLIWSLPLIPDWATHFVSDPQECDVFDSMTGGQYVEWAARRCQEIPK